MNINVNKKPFKIFEKLNPALYKKYYDTSQPSDIYTRNAKLVELSKVNAIQQINIIKENIVSISIDTEKAFDHIQHTFIIKKFSGKFIYSFIYISKGSSSA